MPYTAITGSKVLPGIRKAYSAVEKYQLVGAYGIQHRATSDDGRPEIILEGSQDGLKWTVRRKKVRLVLQTKSSFYFPN